MVLELNSIAVHVWRHQPRCIDAVVARRSDALQHRRLEALIPRLSDSKDVEMLVGNDVAHRCRLIAY